MDKTKALSGPTVCERELSMLAQGMWGETVHAHFHHIKTAHAILLSRVKCHPAQGRKAKA